MSYLCYGSTQQSNFTKSASEPSVKAADPNNSAHSRGAIGQRMRSVPSTPSISIHRPIIVFCCMHSGTARPAMPALFAFEPKLLADYWLCGEISCITKVWDFCNRWCGRHVRLLGQGPSAALEVRFVSRMLRLLRLYIL